MDLSMKNGKTAGEAAARGSEAELVFFGGPILTMTEPAEVEAVAVAGGRILAAGTRASVRRFCTPATRHVDLAGRTMLPGFIDAHSHFIDTSLRTAWVDVRSAPLGPVRTMADIVDLLARRAQETKPGEWIVGWGYDDTNLAEMRHPDRRDLDRASSRHPIVLQHISGWVTASNSLALARAGIDEHVQNTETMVFQRDQEGALSGVIEASRCPVLSQVPPLSDEAVVRSMAQGSAMYLARGCTTAQEGWIADPAWITQAERALAQGLLRVRLVLYPLAQDISLEDYVKVFPAAASGTALDSEARLVLGAAKLSADGSIQAYTGYLSSPYHKCPPGKPGYRGYPSNDPDFLAARIADLHRTPTGVRQTRVRELQSVFRLGSRLDSMISTYSHGMHQKICLMASLIHRPKLWLLDEPITGLDPQTAAALCRYMVFYKRKGNAVLYSSHNLDTVARTCDRVYLINGGKIAGHLDLTQFPAAEREQKLSALFAEKVGETV